MYLTKQTKGQIYLVIITTIIILSAFLLIQNMTAPTYNNIGQAPAQQIVSEPEPQAAAPATDHSAPIQNDEALPPVVAEQPAEQTAITDSTTETTAPATANMQSVIIIVVAIILVAAVGVGIYFLLPMIKNRFKKEDIDDLEEIEEPQDDIEDVAADQPEQDDHDDEAEAGFNDSNNDNNVSFDFDYSGFEDSDPYEAGRGDVVEPETDAEPGTMNDLELCCEIERLTVQSNQRAAYIAELANAQGFDVLPEIIQIEEYDELPAETSELEQEVARLKNKANLQIDYIEKSQKKQANSEEILDNNHDKKNNNFNSNTDDPFFDAVANALYDMQCNNLIILPKRKRNFVYVPITKFFDRLSQTVQDYNKNNALEFLIQREIINAQKYDSVQEKTRVLKVNSKQFDFLTTEIVHDAGA